MPPYLAALYHMRSLAATLFTLAACAHAGTWTIIASKIGGGPLGVSCYEDGLTCITAVSQILPAGYEAKRSADGGATWATVPDADLFIFALYNSAVFGEFAVISGMEFIQKSSNKGLNFTQVPGSLAIGGGEIVRKVLGPSGAPIGFAILGLSNDGNSNGLVVSLNNVAGPWAEKNIPALNAGVIATDGAFFAGDWIVAGEEFETQRQRRLGSSRGGRRGRGARAAKATYATQVVRSGDGGATWQQLYYNATVATLGLACASPKNCVLVQEDADFAYIQTTTDGFATVATTLVDAAEGAALVEASVDGAGCFVVVGGAVSGGGQSSASYHSCDQGLTWEADELANFPFDLLFTDIDCGAGVNASCWATLCASNDGAGNRRPPGHPLTLLLFHSTPSHSLYLSMQGTTRG